MRDLINIVEAALNEKAHPNRLIMYHGTSAYNAKQIAQMGFIPEPDSKQYGEDSEMESLPGSYFTNNLSVAIKYAWTMSQESADAPAICVAQIDLVNAVPDEDVVRPALTKALKQKTPASYLKTAHHELVGGHDEEFPRPDDLLLAYRDAYLQYYRGGGDDDVYDTMRDLLNQVCHAYARMAFHTNPRYLGGHDGHHTVRLPQGLGVEHLVSVFELWLDVDEFDGISDYNVTPILGTPLDEHTIETAIQACQENGVFD